MAKQLKWGIIGTGGIATDFAQALEWSERCSVVNVVGSSPAKAEAFKKEWSLPKASSSLEEMLGDSAVDAVYVATPHPMHKDQAIACIGAGKHVLCEKPICVTAKDAEAVVAAAKEHNVFLMEAFMYRCHPLMQRVIETIRDGTIGKVVHVRANFGFRVPYDPKGRLFNPELGGGGILDVGGYPVSFARLIAGLVSGTNFEEPEAISAVGLIGKTGVDEHTTALLSFPSGLTATVGCGVYYDLGTEAVVYGEKGRIVLPDPWIPGGDRQRCDTEFTIHLDDKDPEKVVVTTDIPTYGIEAEVVADALPNLEGPWPAMTWEDTIGNMRVLDAWRAALEE
jgi:predicted dehydrogenase